MKENIKTAVNTATKHENDSAPTTADDYSEYTPATVYSPYKKTFPGASHNPLINDINSQPLKYFYLKIKTEILSKISSYGTVNIADIQSKLMVFVCDRMFENWIIADVEGIKIRAELIKQSARQNYYDGQSGCTVLKRIMNIKYKKVLHAPILFKAVEMSRAKDNSPSFNRFFISVN